MREIQVGETRLLECERCRGTWIDGATFEHICADGEDQAAVLHKWPAVARSQAPPKCATGNAWPAEK